MSDVAQKILKRTASNLGRGKEWMRSWIPVLDRGMFLVLIASLTLIYSPVALFSPTVPAVGEVASKDMKAGREILIEDVETTWDKRREASSRVVPVLDLDPGMMTMIVGNLRDDLTWLARERNRPTEENKTRDLRGQFIELLEGPVPMPVWELLVQTEDFAPVIKDLEQWLMSHSHRQIMADTEAMKVLTRGPYTVRNLSTGVEYHGIGVGGVISLNTARRLLHESVQDSLARLPPPATRMAGQRSLQPDPPQHVAKPGGNRQTPRSRRRRRGTGVLPRQEGRNHRPGR
ncbi:MAG: hypothetical protein H7831_02940 [Magnetococcus sp. WYHC-3]